MAQHFPHGDARIVEGPTPDKPEALVVVLADCWCGDRTCAWQLGSIFPTMVKVNF